jgi:8-hydroxy-5-deazaflavin:NADPH oxidoreductase
MKIGIIGAGHIGSTLAHRFTELGHKVFVANSRGPATLSTVAAETGATAVEATVAVQGVDLAVVTIPMKNVPQLPRGLFSGLAEDIPVVDTCNYYPRERDGLIRPIEAGIPESVWVQEQIGHPVIKAFNCIYARHLLELGKTSGTTGRIALPVAGDRAASKKIVLELVDDLGFDPIDAGPLSESWRQQPGSLLYCKDFDAAGVREALAGTPKERVSKWRAEK